MIERKTKQLHTVRTIAKSKIKIVERDKYMTVHVFGSVYGLQ